MSSLTTSSEAPALRSWVASVCRSEWGEYALVIPTSFRYRVIRWRTSREGHPALAGEAAGKHRTGTLTAWSPCHCRRALPRLGEVDHSIDMPFAIIDAEGALRVVDGLRAGYSLHSRGGRTAASTKTWCGLVGHQ